jgi:uncharacterized protein (TIGR02145 family)
MKKIAILSLFIMAVQGLTAQVNLSHPPVVDITNSNVFLDASKNFSSAAGAPNNVGKGIVVPSVDLVNFEFNANFLSSTEAPSFYDGMLVYNSATGTTLTTGNRSSTATAVTPGFYYFSNPSGATNENITGGVWKTLASGASKFVDGTDPLNAVYTAGNVGIGTATPNASAALDIESTNKGFLPPRVQLTSLTSPAPLADFVPGMVVYCIGSAGTAPNNVSEGLYISSTFNWVRLSITLTGGGDISIVGNSTSPTYNINNGVVASENLASAIKVGGGTPSSSSVSLEAAGNNKGFVISTTSNLSSIVEPVEGMMVYSTTEKCLRIYTGTQWSNCLSEVPGDISTGGSSASSAYDCGIAISATPVFGKKASGLTKVITATVTTPGDYNIMATSATLPKLIFSATGNFSAAGSSNITLIGIGHLDVVGTHTFTLNTTPSCTFDLTVSAPTFATGNGSTFNGFYNGFVNNLYTGSHTQVFHDKGENFATYANCSSKTISQSSQADCPASVTGASGTIYPLVWINGQCWMSENVKEVPSSFATVANWVATTPRTPVSDNGYWGFVNYATNDGTAGWATTETLTNGGGYLYQWSAAMNNTATERGQGVCPTGYHVPSDCEFSFLEHGLGLSVAANGTFGFREGNGTIGITGAPQSRYGGKLRSQSTYQNNVTGFNMKMTGRRNPDNGEFRLVGTWGYLWTSTQNDALTAINKSYSNSMGVGRGVENKAQGYALRCLKD